MKRAGYVADVPAREMVTAPSSSGSRSVSSTFEENSTSSSRNRRAAMREGSAMSLEAGSLLWVDPREAVDELRRLYSALAKYAKVMEPADAHRPARQLDISRSTAAR